MRFVVVGDNSMVIEPTAAMSPAPKRKAHSLTGRITLPLLSAAAVTALGLWLCYNSLHKDAGPGPAAAVHNSP